MSSEEIGRARNRFAGLGSVILSSSTSDMTASLQKRCYARRGKGLQLDSVSEVEESDLSEVVAAVQKIC